LNGFIESNATKMNQDIWEKTCITIVFLFEWTTPSALFDVVDDDYIIRTASTNALSLNDTAPDARGINVLSCLVKVADFGR
jgi:hypothetical protein